MALVLANHPRSCDICQYLSVAELFTKEIVSLNGVPNSSQ